MPLLPQGEYGAERRERDLFTIRMSLSGRQNVLVKNLEQLDAGCRLMESFAHEYDISGEKEGNGFRSFCKAMAILISDVADLCNDEATVHKSLARRRLTDFCSLSQLMVVSMDSAFQVRRKGPNFRTKEATDLDRKILSKACVMTEAEIRPFFGPIGFFFLHKGLRQEWFRLVSVIHFMGIGSLWHKVRYLTSRTFATGVQVKQTLRPSIAFLRRQSDVRAVPMRWFFRYDGNRDVRMKWIEVPVRVNEWVIALSEGRVSVLMQSPRPRSHRTVRCLLIEPKNRGRNDSLVLHGHGGAFLAGSVESEAPVAAARSAGLAVSFLLPVYALAPETPFPAAVQDLLDVYRFVTSSHPMVQQLIGFYPQKVLLSGASAGGALSLSLCIALNEIRKQQHKQQQQQQKQQQQQQQNQAEDTIRDKVVMPVGVHCQFPAAIVGFIAVPSYSVLDFLCTPAVMSLAASFYCQRSLHVRDEMWFLKSDANETMRRSFSDPSRDPLFSPLAFDSWHELSDVPLSLLACEMDCLLDHSVLLAKRWTGSLDFDLAHGMPHAFVYSDHPSTHPYARLVIQRMHRLLNLTQ